MKVTYLFFISFFISQNLFAYRLHVNSNIEQSIVLIDNKSVGKTPLDIELPQDHLLVSVQSPIDKKKIINKNIDLRITEPNEFYAFFPEAAYKGEDRVVVSNVTSFFLKATEPEVKKEDSPAQLKRKPTSDVPVPESTVVESNKSFIPGYYIQIYALFAQEFIDKQRLQDDLILLVSKISPKTNAIEPHFCKIRENHFQWTSVSLGPISTEEEAIEVAKRLSTASYIRYLNKCEIFDN